MNGSTTDAERVTNLPRDALAVIDDELSEDDIRDAADDDWTPNDLQVAYARVYVSAAPRATITEMAEQAGMARKTVYCWRKSRAWRAWMANVAMKAAGLAVGRVWKAVIDKATAGDIRASGMVLRRFDPHYRTSMQESDAKREPGGGAIPEGTAQSAHEALNSP